MKLSEWIEVVAVRHANWPGEQFQMTDQDIELSYPTVRDLDRDDALEAVISLARDGKQYPPSPGEIAARVHDTQHPVPSFEEAWDSIYRAMWKWRPFDPTANRRVLEAVERDSGPEVAGWLATYGVEAFVKEPVDGPNGGAVRNRIRQAYENAMSEPATRRRMTARAPGELRRLDPLTEIQAESMGQPYGDMSPQQIEDVCDDDD